MNDDELEKRMEFILEQQAQFSADIQRLNELHTKAEARLTRLEHIVLGLHENTNTKINALVDSHIRLVDSHNHLLELHEETNAKINALIDSHTQLAGALTQTNERLDTFIGAVERYITEGRNGKSQNPDEDNS